MTTKRATFSPNRRRPPRRKVPRPLRRRLLDRKVRDSLAHHRRLEDHAMAVAKKYFRHEGFGVEDVSARRSYDVLCRQGTRELQR
jgi:hypothetical protein